MAINFDIQSTVGKSRQQMTRRVEWTKRVKAADINAGAGLAATQSAGFITLPAGYVHDRCDVVLRKAEGEAAQINVGLDGEAKAFLGDASVNGTLNAQATGTAAGAGRYFHTDTVATVNVDAAEATVNVAEVDITFTGYMIETA